MWTKHTIRERKKEVQIQCLLHEHSRLFLRQFLLLQRVVHVYMCMYMCMYVCMYIIFVKLDKTNVHTYIHTYIHTHIHTYTYTYIHIYVHTHIYIHTYVHIYIHTHIHIYTWTTHCNSKNCLRMLLWWCKRNITKCQGGPKKDRQ